MNFHENRENHWQFMILPKIMIFALFRPPAPEPCWSLQIPMPFEAPLREFPRFLVISMKITNFSGVSWNGGEFHENWWFRGFVAYLLRNIHNANEFQCFLGLRGSRNCGIYDNSTILGDFMEITKNGVNFKKMGGILTFCSPGGLRTYRICNVFVWFGVGATRMTENHIFMKIHPF